MKRVYANERWCIDCGRCEVACKTAHSEFRDTVKAYLFESDTAVSRIWVQGDAHLSLAMSCRHCEHPRCVEGCISGALRKDAATGLVLVDQSRCVGCRTCVSACPFGCIEVHELPNRAWRDGKPGARTKGLAFKCDLCAADGVAGALGLSSAPGVPACVAACPNRALVFAEAEEVGA